MVPGVPCVNRENWGSESDSSCFFFTCSLFENNIIYRMLSYVNIVVQRFMSYTLMSYTNARAVRGRRKLDIDVVERFRNGSSIHEFYNRKASQMSRSS